MLDDKFYIKSIILESKNFNSLKKQGVVNPFEQKDSVVICSYNYPMFLKLDKLLGGRLYYGYTAFNNYNIALFGNKIEMIGSSEFAKNTSLEYFYIDSGYLQTLFLRGVVLSILIFWGYFVISRKSVIEKNIELFIWIVITSAYNILGSTLIDIWYNPIFFIAFKYMINWKGTFRILGKRYRIVYRRSYT